MTTTPDALAEGGSVIVKRTIDGQTRGRWLNSGSYKRLKLFGDNLVTVHPLGSCNMSDGDGGGTVNHLGQVFNGADGSIHLYVAKGSIIPTALGVNRVNPYITISALADRISTHIVANPMHADLFAPSPSVA